VVTNLYTAVCVPLGESVVLAFALGANIGALQYRPEPYCIHLGKKSMLIMIGSSFSEKCLDMEIPKGPIKKINDAFLTRLREEFPRLWGERTYLRSIMEHEEVSRRNMQYVALHAIRGQSDGKDARIEPLIGLIEKSVKEFKQVLVLGEPGCGKTSTLYSAAFRFCQTARYGQNLCWTCLLLSIVIPTLLAYRIWDTSWGQLLKYPLATVGLLIGIAELCLLERIFRRWQIPVLIELRSYSGESVE